MFDTLSQYSLAGRTAIVTGGSTGLGLAITRCLVGAGAHVAVISYDEESRAALDEFGDAASFYRFDITDTDRTPEVTERIIAERGPVTILVNNAGNHCKKPIEEMSVEEYVGVLNVHLVGAFALTKALFAHMKANGGGSVIFQASMTSYIGQPAVAGYATAKAGYLGLVHTLATEGGPSGVRVNAIAPGWIDTPMFHKATDNDAPRLNKILGRIPMNHVGDPMDIGMAAAFLCSDAARYITGVCLPVDGGALIGF
ncbi:3-oxoacyl-ACP reductase [Bifidobacterium sp. DSM 109958]|uniref:3-oxoacyl-ACP reductase n=1 Tax=Bifidobacterium moraviense TaxID=2675323 RepID=A0A7Y0F124_9BIFI|nr:SDR family NAD(P)-dependent oxidoreductase [Bifidobacterium sp. DSM 109958]NMN00058.1 3-oxoacyl-ACP reductase [Bifidobacterium sp. DSM 109958]